MKKKIIAGLTALSICLISVIPAMAETVYYNGDKVNVISWDHGRSWGVYSYSDVQTGKYTHSSTANTTSSGWKEPGTQAHASEFVGKGTATAYWNCK
ncbi:hypothetical protein [Clostridium estertheticum]|uniref:hypothetical protein n=1 Tax=Clostridium estertheticum TaxID=238834 RepID=UPI00124D2771|nr:hypothetical protein [Clostridium estertheticum]MBU3171920.1 lactococcin 972 family bacteriocin [Clostridium estertheticum]MBZ9618369.1 lactococcin 972 family bacteriocin [Clostridium estertheticum subsp. laramiense]WAG76134.1 lactococcin 972 family bacteriocin [Clostridium estertheticum]